MSEEPWQVPLRQFVETQIASLERRMLDGFESRDLRLQEALAASEKAIAKAETAQERRNEATNEFRGQLADQAARLIPREVAEAQFAEMSKRIENLENRVSASTGRDEGTRASIAIALAGAAIVLSPLIGYLVSHLH